jgi:diaminopimelate epimerase
MTLHFTKMHGLGNDFVVIDAVTQRVSLSRRQIRKLADRHLGIGCDQVLLVEPPITPDADFMYRIYNADGSDAQQCGNGARCFGRFVVDRYLTNKSDLRVNTVNGVIQIRVHAHDDISVDMGAPRLAPDSLPFLPQDVPDNHQYQLRLSDGRRVRFTIVSMGNPHAVVLCRNLQRTPVEAIGKGLQSHPSFPESVNVGFLEVASRNQARLRVYERGAGETLACGSGACAAMVAARLQNLLDDTAELRLTGGTLKLSWAGENQPVIMRGAATRVFDGRIRLQA